jgi:hypothetical protein
MNLDLKTSDFVINQLNNDYVIEQMQSMIKIQLQLTLKTKEIPL